MLRRANCGKPAKPPSSDLHLQASRLLVVCLFYLDLEAKRPAGRRVCMCTAYSAGCYWYCRHLKTTMPRYFATYSVWISVWRPSCAPDYHLHPGPIWVRSILEAKLAKCFKKRCGNVCGQFAGLKWLAKIAKSCLSLLGPRHLGGQL